MGTKKTMKLISAHRYHCLRLALTLPHLSLINPTSLEVPVQDVFLLTPSCLYLQNNKWTKEVCGFFLCSFTILPVQLGNGLMVLLGVMIIPKSHCKNALVPKQANPVNSQNHDKGVFLVDTVGTQIWFEHFTRQTFSECNITKYRLHYGPIPVSCNAGTTVHNYSLSL